MTTRKYYRALGLMSGTSADGLDLGLLETDGETNLTFLTTSYSAYPEALRGRILDAYTRKDIKDYPALEKDITTFQTQAVAGFLSHYGVGHVDVIGFHGQTVDHVPPVYDKDGVCVKKGRTVQLGDGAQMAQALGIDVVNDFRANDMSHGGQGAPLAPLFHWAVMRNFPGKLRYPALWLNVGGVANLTYVPSSLCGPQALQAFDTGPGNALIDDWVRYKTKGAQAYDAGGQLAMAACAPQGAKSTVQAAIVGESLQAPYFSMKGPKSMDRQLMHEALAACKKQDLTLEEGAMILTSITIEGIRHAIQMLETPPQTIVVSGGGVHNRAIMAGLNTLAPRVISADRLRLPQEAVEAYAFAYLAVRSLRQLPLSFPGTTRVVRAVSGGRVHENAPLSS